MQDDASRRDVRQENGNASASKGGIESAGELVFEIFCAIIFLGMIGLVFYNAFLRYVFSSSYPPSEEWARFLFIYITFFGAIEAFYRKKHIAVEMFVDLLQGVPRKSVEVVAAILGMVAMGLLLYGGVVNVRTANAGERITTLDGEDRALSPEMLVIADANKPVAVAGVMGGEYSGIMDDTTAVVFESACFDASLGHVRQEQPERVPV